MRLTWREVSDYPGAPSEEHALLTRLNAERPKGELWLALEAPLSPGSAYRVLSVSLDYGLRFTAEAQGRLRTIASRVETELEPEDIKGIAETQRALGNRPLIAKVTPHNARFVVPADSTGRLRVDLSSVWSELESVTEAE